MASGDISSTAATLHWTAVADNGTDVSSGKVASYDFRFVVVAGSSTDCSALTAADYATATPFAAQPAVSAAVGATETGTVTFPAASTNRKTCIAATATDLAGNVSTPSDWLFSVDSVPPAKVADLAASNPTLSGATLSFTASGNDGSVGTAAAYDLRRRPGVCTTLAAFDFLNAPSITPPAGPSPAGATETGALSGLDYASSYCVALRVADDFGNFSAASNLVTVATLVPDTGAQITAVRAQISAGPTSPVSLSLPIQSAIVTYTKAAVGGAADGAADGAGFFLQALTGPAIFVAIDPTTIAGGVLVGDKLDLVVSEGAWLGCATPPCTANNSMYAVTATTATRRSTGATLPAAVDVSTLTTATWPLPIGAGPWAPEHKLTTATGTITGTFTTAAGFSKVQVLTAGVTTANTNLQLRVPTTVATALALRSGMAIRVGTTPLWRTDVEADLAAWQASELQVSPVVVDVSPADGSFDVTGSTVIVTFNQPIDILTAVGLTSAGPCSGAIQLSGDSTFTNCLPLTTSLDATNKVLTITSTFAPASRYRLKVTNALHSLAGLAALQFTSVNGFSTPATACSAATVVISQVFGGGGNAGSVYKNDFIELHNRGNVAVAIGGWSVQYASAAGTTWTVTPIPPATTIPAGGYFLIQESLGAGGTTLLPTPDAIGTIAMNATDGKVALSNSLVALSGSCPATAAVVDQVSFGSGNCGTSTPSLSAANSAQRNNLGNASTLNTWVDFTVAPAAPRNSGATKTFSACPSSSNATGLGLPSELAYCITQFPNTQVTVAPGATVPSATESVYGRFFQSSVTPSGGNNSSVRAQVGYSRAGTNPFFEAIFYAATYNPSCVGCVNNDEWQASFPAPAVGDYRVVYRFSVDSGATWTFCDLHGNGSNSSAEGGPDPTLLPFDASQLLPLKVQ